LPPFGVGELGPHLAQNVAWTKAHLCTKCRLDALSRLVTMDMGRKLGREAPLPLWGGSWVPMYHNVAWTKAHLHAKCHLEQSSRLTTIDMGQNWGGA